MSDIKLTLRAEDKASGKIRSVTKASKDFTKQVTKGAGASRQADLALIELGRGAQDAKFGFAGLGNNLTRMVEIFGDMRRQSGSAKGALKALGGALLGPGALIAAVGALIVYAPDIVAFFSGTEDGAKQSAAEQKKFNDSLANTAELLRVLAGLRGASQTEILAENEKVLAQQIKVEKAGGASKKRIAELEVTLAENVFKRVSKVRQDLEETQSAELQAALARFRFLSRAHGDEVKATEILNKENSKSGKLVKSYTDAQKKALEAESKAANKLEIAYASLNAARQGKTNGKGKVKPIDPQTGTPYTANEGTSTFDYQGFRQGFAAKQQKGRDKTLKDQVAEDVATYKAYIAEVDAQNDIISGAFESLGNNIAQSLGATEGVMGAFVGSLIQSLLQLAAQQITSAATTKATSAAKVAAYSTEASAAAVAAAANTAASAGPGGAVLLPILIGAALAAVSAAFSGLGGSKAGGSRGGGAKAKPTGRGTFNSSSQGGGGGNAQVVGIVRGQDLVLQLQAANRIRPGLT